MPPLPGGARPASPSQIRSSRCRFTLCRSMGRAGPPLSAAEGHPVTRRRRRLQPPAQPRPPPAAGRKRKGRAAAPRRTAPRHRGAAARGAARFRFRPAPAAAARPTNLCGERRARPSGPRRHRAVRQGRAGRRRRSAASRSSCGPPGPGSPRLQPPGSCGSGGCLRLAPRPSGEPLSSRGPPGSKGQRSRAERGGRPAPPRRAGPARPPPAGRGCAACAGPALRPAVLAQPAGAGGQRSRRSAVRECWAGRALPRQRDASPSPGTREAGHSVFSSKDAHGQP